ncbi:sodium-coupled monocarboxylate transporter 2-like [Teleopsis dalmanni]|uniref:sodium-coupled monocarboxylate transporter 2-like n=1 Tax=Teleopsis dalmanni TaxID=139649 RepID=UPI0018CC8B13|nr:sodium-coupled monocarboxylate transporter 2-like [Teleopsis dalmanni]
MSSGTANITTFINQPTTMNTASNIISGITFGTVDYFLFVLLLLVSASIGVYFGFFSKSKNTTDEYLMGNKQMKTWPIAISIITSQLSAVAIVTVPSEIYSYGISFSLLLGAVILTGPIMNSTIIPVFYENNVHSCYEYLEMRFNKRVRQIITITFLLHSLLLIPVHLFLPSLALSQVSGLNIHLINAIVTSICIFYTMLGGIKAVVWTDVVQALIMFISMVAVGLVSTFKLGGFNAVMTNAYEGGRLNFNFSLDPRVRTTVWNGLFSGMFVWISYIGLNQSCVQRLVSMPTVRNAKRAVHITTIGVFVAMIFNVLIGIAMYARFHGCDPVLGGVVSKSDKLVPLFIQDVIGHLKGMPGIFISSIFSAALSSLSAVLNSIAGVCYFDYIKPFVVHTDAKANAIMKVLVVLMGIYCVLGGFIVQNFNSIMQLISTVAGIGSGAIVGIFFLGVFVPRVNGKVAFIAIITSVGTMLWIILQGQIRLKAGIIDYIPLSTTIDKCDAQDLNDVIKSVTTTSSIQHFSATTTEVPLVTNAFSSNREFSIYEIAFYWYKVIGGLIIWLVAIPLSYVWKIREGETQNLKLYAPIMRKFIGKKTKPADVEDSEAAVPLKEGESKVYPKIINREK